ncbi:MAG: helix-turn-helix domain-containing protein [Fidelibacterota bacterium]
MKKFNNNRRRTAETLGLSERTLYRKINEYGLEKKQKQRK